MELKEMAETGVIINNRTEFKEFALICEGGGWSKPTDMPLPKIYGLCEIVTWSGMSYKWRDGTITLAQFKERNGIMKYQEGQILVNGSYERKVLGAHNTLYHLSTNGEFDSAGRDFTEQQLNDQGYTLKTDEPEMVELTLEDVAKLKGIPVETLRIKD